MATVAEEGMTVTSEPQKWIVVGKPSNTRNGLKQGPTFSNLTKKTKTTRRIILVQSPKSPALTSPLQARNNINRAFAQNGIKGPVVNAVAKTFNSNIAITTADEYNADFLIEKKFSLGASHSSPGHSKRSTVV